ncbi:arylsulfatase [Pontiellaceae bacterium B12227]|nr:arylsulfatase [Pontiellaceae bacterium B12227]
MKSALPLLILATSLLCAGAQVGDKPNIVYILADDLGYGDLGCYGQEIIQTPNIDQLCREGMRFTNHHSGSTVCAPSRACLMTGQHTGHVWVRSNGNIQLRDDDQDMTIARVLKNEGYHTAMIGKNGLGCNGITPGFANRKGFDYFYGFNSHSAAHHYFAPFVHRNGEKVVFPNNKTHTGDTYIHDEFMKEIMSYLDRRKKDDQPFFLHYAALIPHASLVAPEEWIAKYRGKVKEAPPFKGGGGGRGGEYGPVQEPKATFAGMVSRLDWEVGEIMKKLESLGMAGNTLVIFSSDNGPHQEGGKLAEWFSSSGGLRGHKRDLFEGGVRVPMIAHWPGRVEAGSVSDHLSAFWDVMPTLCELTGATAPEGIDGISFLPTLFKEGEQQQHDYLYWEFSSKGGRRAALTHKWKAVQLGKAPIMLFAVDDLYEEHDVASKHPDVTERFQKLFNEAHTPKPSTK